MIEDVALARVFKQAGLAVGMGDGTDLATCRMYDGWGTLREGYTKSLWSAFGSELGAVGVLGLLWFLYVLPPVAAMVGFVFGRRRLLWIGAGGYTAGVLGRALTAWRTGGRVLDTPAHPVSIGLLTWLTAASWRRRAAGELTWKGRALP